MGFQINIQVRVRFSRQGWQFKARKVSRDSLLTKNTFISLQANPHLLHWKSNLFSFSSSVSYSAVAPLIWSPSSSPHLKLRKRPDLIILPPVMWHENSSFIYLAEEDAQMSQAGALARRTGLGGEQRCWSKLTFEKVAPGTMCIHAVTLCSLTDEQDTKTLCHLRSEPTVQRTTSDCLVSLLPAHWQDKGKA